MTKKRNKRIIGIEQINNKSYIKATKVIDIAKIQIMSHKKNNIEDISKDVYVEHITGETEFITRLDLINNYTFLNYNKIKYRFLRNDKYYFVGRGCEEEYNVIHIGKNVGIKIKDGIVTNGYFIIKKDNLIKPISKESFNKCFIITSYKNCSNYNEDNKDTSVEDIINDNINDKAVENSEPKSEPKSGPVVLNKYQYKAIGKLMCGNKMAGLVIMNISNGQKKEMNIKSVALLANKKLIENVVLVQNSNGRKYLRGNGIVLEELPVFTC